LPVSWRTPRIDLVARTADDVGLCLWKFKNGNRELQIQWGEWGH
jgi:hypothetical protein